jgi:hypothetical protein
MSYVGSVPSTGEPVKRFYLAVAVTVVLAAGAVVLYVDDLPMLAGACGALALWRVVRLTWVRPQSGNGPDFRFLRDGMREQERLRAQIKRAREGTA